MNKYKIIILLIISLFFIKCTSNEDEFKETCNVISCSANTLIYTEYLSILYYNSNFSDKIRFEYNQNNDLVRIHGGLAAIPTGPNQSEYIFLGDVITNIVISSDTIKVEPTSDFLDEYIIKN